MPPTDPRFPLVNEIPKLLSATERQKKAIESMIDAINSYNTACRIASEKLTKDLNVCKGQLYGPDAGIKQS